MLSAGQVVDRYEVQALLGQGGMAAVYRVRHTQLQVDRALKVLTIGHPGVRQRLLLEGRVQASLSHPNIVGVTDVLEVGGQPGLLMEYVEGPSLQQWLAAYRPSLDEALALFRDIVAGVDHAHQRDLIHRDLKPANVLLLRRGDALVAKVADFGLAKVVADEIGEPGATRTGLGMGTPAYMAPEQIRDAKRVDKRGDIFALGSILYELCTGRQAFAGTDILAQLAAVAAGDYTPAREVVPDLPEAVSEVIDRCLRVDREERMPSCAALLQALPAPQPFTWSEEALAAAVPPPEQALPAPEPPGT
ncbi:MAG: serine/threonine protein kinase, partial [Deltaproteobacteria bacterium]